MFQNCDGIVKAVITKSEYKYRYSIKEMMSMPREKFGILTEAMFYMLLCLQKECCGTDIMQQVQELTDGRVRIGPGTLYNLLDQFLKNNMIQETSVQGRKKNYRIIPYGKEILDLEYERIKKVAQDYERSILL